MRRVWQWGVPAAGVALLPWLVFAWLSIPDRSAWDLSLTAVSAVSIGLLAAVALAAGFMGGRKPPLPLCLRCFAWLILMAVLAALILWFTGGWPRFAAIAGTVLLGSITLSWLAAGRPMRDTVRDAPYLAAAGLIGLAGIYLPYYLIWWVPALDSPLAQLCSAITRFLAAYLIAVSAWLAIPALVRRRTEVPA